MSTLPQDIDLNKLLESLEDSEEQKEYSDQVLNFIAFYNLKPGNNLVKATVLYKLFKNWSKADVSSGTFTNRLKEIFPYQVIKDGTFFSLDQSALNLSEAALKLLQTKPERHLLPSYKRHFESFLNRYQVTEGTYWVESYILYYLYDKWLYEIKRKTNHLGYQSFNNLMSLYFTVKKPNTNQSYVVRINKENLMKHITEEHMEQIRQGYKNANKRRQKVKKKQS